MCVDVLYGKKKISILEQLFCYDCFESTWKSSRYCQSILLKCSGGQVWADSLGFARQNTWLWDLTEIEFLI